MAGSTCSRPKSSEGAPMARTASRLESIAARCSDTCRSVASPSLTTARSTPVATAASSAARIDARSSDERLWAAAVLRSTLAAPRLSHGGSGQRGCRNQRRGVCGP
eukprot:2022794-Prymnesium_polylepis.2